MKFLSESVALLVLSATVAALASTGVKAQDANEWAEEASTASFPYPVPLGLPAPPVPKDNPVTKPKVELGKLLYFDGRLSRNKLVSCATCHDPRRGWTDQAPVSTGIGGQKGARSAPPVFNSAYNELQFWDGRAPSLEAQAAGPIQNPIEMGFTLEGMIKRIGGIKGYRPYFKAAFGDEKVTVKRVAQAIASFERTILAGNSAYDRSQAGDASALSEPAKRGLALFFSTKANCDICHTGPNFSDSQFHNLGVGMDAPHPDLGRYAVTKNDSDRGAFKTSGLRGLAYTAPYMHDGSERTLEEVVDFYDRGGRPNPHLDKDIHPLHLSAQDRKDLVAFLMALSGDPVIVEPPKTFPQ